MNTSLNLKMKTANDKNISQALTYIDPNASNSDLKGFAQGLVSLTTNTLEQINKITTEDIDKTYTPLIPSVVSGNSNIVPSISDNVLTYSITDCLAVNEKYVYDEDTAYFVYTIVSIKASTVNVTQLVSISVVNQKSESMIYPSITRSGDNIQLTFWIAGIESADELQGEQFIFTVPEGQSGSTTWDSTTFTVKLV